jgi:hypothetical protein
MGVELSDPKTPIINIITPFEQQLKTNSDQCKCYIPTRVLQCVLRKYDSTLPGSESKLQKEFVLSNKEFQNRKVLVFSQYLLEGIQRRQNLD